MRRDAILRMFPVTIVICLLCLAFFGAEFYFTQKLEDHPKPLEGFIDIDGGVMLNMGADYLPYVRRGQVWRLLSSAFLHWGFYHIAMNLLVLWDLGRSCELLLGKERYTVAYLASALGGSLGSLAYASVAGPIVGAGASGALSGLIGLVLAFSIRHRDRDLRDQMVRWIIYIVVFSLIVGNVGHAAHAGGFAVGAVFGYFTPRYVSSRHATFWRIPFWGSAGLGAAALAAAVVYFALVQTGA